MAEGEGSRVGQCIFCQISAKEKETKIVYEDEEFVAFPDIRPAAEKHFLIIPKTHFGNPKTLDGRHFNFVCRMKDVAHTILDQQNGDINDAKIGFHWPPFNSIEHLHLHVIFPASRIHLMSRMVYKSNSWWFATIEWTLEHLGKKIDNKQVQDEGVETKQQDKEI